MVGYGRARRDSRLPPSGTSPIATAPPGGGVDSPGVVSFRGALVEPHDLDRGHDIRPCGVRGRRARESGEMREHGFSFARAAAWSLPAPGSRQSGPWISEFVLALPECPDREGSQPIPAPRLSRRAARATTATRPRASPKTRCSAAARAPLGASAQRGHEPSPVSENERGLLRNSRQPASCLTLRGPGPSAACPAIRSPAAARNGAGAQAMAHPDVRLVSRCHGRPRGRSTPVRGRAGRRTARSLERRAPASAPTQGRSR